jgi:hypothetical protein
MGRFGRPVLLGFLALTSAATVARAAGSLEELLEETRTARAQQAKANAGREQEFVQRRDQQAALLAQAQKDRDAAAARSQALSSQFDANEVKLTELGELRNSRLGSLGELFGVVRQASADAASVVYDSMISAQFPSAMPYFFAGLKAGLPNALHRGVKTRGQKRNCDCHTDYEGFHRNPPCSVAVPMALAVPSPIPMNIQHLRSL